MNADKQHKRIGIIGHGGEGLNKSTMAAIEMAKAKGYEVVMIDPDNVKDHGYNMDTMVKDDLKRLGDEIKTMAENYPVVLPETRLERRAKARKKKRK